MITEIVYILEDLEILYAETVELEAALAVAVLEAIEEDVALDSLVYFCQNGVYPV